jgi:archaellum component FlaC
VILRLLRNIEIELHRIIDDIGDLKVRMTAAEEAAVGINRRLDRIDQRLDRIERRLELVEPNS